MYKFKFIVEAFGVIFLVGFMIMIGSISNVASSEHAPYTLSPVSQPSIRFESVEYYNLAFSTYIGGNDYEHARDVFVDSQGYVYITGGTSSPNFPTTAGAYQRTYDTSGTQIGCFGHRDAFVMKFSPNGNLVWSTYLGGPNYDLAFGIEVDSQGYVYIAGQAGPGFPTTQGVLQPTFQGGDFGCYGQANTFVTKLSPDGSSLVWSTYVGTHFMARDIAIDNNGNVFVPLGYMGAPNPLPPSSWFFNAFQKTPVAGNESGALKINGEGSQVLWATWMGGSGDDEPAASIRVDTLGNVYLGISTQSADMPTTTGVWDRSFNGGVDFFVTKLTSDGSDQLFGTYIGGSNDEYINTHNLALDNYGNVYISVGTSSSNFPTSNGVLQENYGGGSFDIGVAKFSSTGALLSSTFIGGFDVDSPDGIYVDNLGAVFLTGQTGSSNFPITSGAYQMNNQGGTDAVLARLSPDFSQLLYSTYLGGGSDEDGRAGYLGQDGNIYITGQTNGSGWPILSAYQDTYAGGSLDAVLAKFSFSQSPGSTPTSPPSNPSACKVFIPVIRKSP